VRRHSCHAVSRLCGLCVYLKHNINKLGSVSEFLTRRNVIKTNKASGLTAQNTPVSVKADQLDKAGASKAFDAWVERHREMTERGETWKQYFTAYSNYDKRLTDWSSSTFEKYLPAITRAVKKYGSYENARKAYLKETRKAYVEIVPFVKWCPAGQRGKNADKPNGKRQECYNALRKAGFTAHAAETALNICGVK